MKRSMAMRLIRYNHRDEKTQIFANPGNGNIIVKTVGQTYRYNFNNGVLTGNGYTYTDKDIAEMENNNE